MLSKLIQIPKYKGALLFSIAPVLITATAMILSILCVFAGHKPGFMQEYSVFTLNTSRIGENAVLELDSAINKINFNLKREEPAATFNPPIAITIAPTTMITMAPRGLGSELGHLTSKAHSEAGHLTSEAAGEASTLKSKASSLTSAAGAAATSAIGSIKQKVINEIDSAYANITKTFGLSDFYTVHMMGVCTGDYVTSNGTVIKLGDVTSDLKAKEHEEVRQCGGLSALDPLSIVRIVYWIGIVLTIISLLLGITGIFWLEAAKWNVRAAVAAFCVICMASAITHGVAKGAHKLIDFTSGHIGIAGYVGYKFLALTWAATILLLISALLWTALYYVGEHMPRLSKLPRFRRKVKVQEISRPVRNWP